MTDKVETTWLRDIQKLSPKPGDILVVHFQEKPYLEQLGWFRKQITEILPDHPVLFVAPAVEIEVIGAEGAATIQEAREGNLIPLAWKEE